MYRENDKVTRWIRENWREPFAEHKNLWLAMAVARQINWPDTLRAIGFPKRWNPAKVLEIMRKRAKAGEKNYSGAYMLTAGGGNRGVDKPYITVMRILDPLYRFASNPAVPYTPMPTLEESCKWFRQFYGFGPFIAYEVVTDLRHTRYLRDATDIYTWANPGPGARRGLNRLYGRNLNDHPPVTQLVAEMRVLFEQVEKVRDKALLPTLEMRDVEHSLCETDKMLRARERMATGNTRIGLDAFRPVELEQKPLFVP